MGEISKREDEWQRKAMAAAIAGARKMALATKELPVMTPIGRLTDEQWGWITTQVIFEWIAVRIEQATTEQIDFETAVRLIDARPSPCDVGAIAAILPRLANAPIDWSKPLTDWSHEGMLAFLSLAYEMIKEAVAARDRAPGGVLSRKPEAVSD
jgi:hypothetical protein